MTDFIYDRLAGNGREFSSSALDFIAYNRENSLLAVEFQSGTDIYVYEDVPESVYNLFVEAESPGNFYRDYIQGNFARALDVDYNGYVGIKQPEPVVTTGNSTDGSASFSSTIFVNTPLSKFGVKWTGSFNSSDERMGPFEFLTDAQSEADALANFWETAKSLHGDSVTAKIVSVTHYF